MYALEQREGNIYCLRESNLDTYKQGRRIVRLVVGFTVLAIGVALMVLPGPAIVVIPVGLAILATELVWARRLLNRLKDQARKIRPSSSSPPSVK